MNSNGISPNFENCNGINQKYPLLFNCFNSTFQQHLEYFENNFYHGYYCSRSMNQNDVSETWNLPMLQFSGC